ncbi:hypothetical protein PAPHI01_2023 [Pancytospora philotis]|nr:hypothetical protein PAPHI01_2023 [Pancytospora philotis]
MEQSGSKNVEIAKAVLNRLGVSFDTLHPQICAVFYALRQKDGLWAAVCSFEFLICAVFILSALVMLFYGVKFARTMLSVVIMGLIVSALSPYQATIYNWFVQRKASHSAGVLRTILDFITMDPGLPVLLIAFLGDLVLQLVLGRILWYALGGVVVYYGYNYTCMVMHPDNLVVKGIILAAFLLAVFAAMRVFKALINVPLGALYALNGSLMILTIFSILFGWPAGFEKFNPFKSSSIETAGSYSTNFLIWVGVAAAGFAWQMQYLIRKGMFSDKK